MNKTVCDRCGKEIVQKGALESLFDLSFKCDAKVWNDMMHGWQSIELCDECNGKFKDWLKNKKCKCSKNENVVELLDLIDSHEKKICEQSGKIEQLEKENEMLKNSTVKELLESMDIEVSVSIKKKDE